MIEDGNCQTSDRDEPAESPWRGAVALYRFFDSDGRLLYVGISSVPARRWAFHRVHAATTWWPQAAVKQVRWFSERRDAAAAELRAIRSETPLYNSGGAPSPLRELAPDEKVCPQTNLQRFHEATAQATAPWRWFNADVAVAVTLTNDVRQGTLPIGGRLPSVSTLVNRFGVSPATIRRAIRLLQEDGAVSAQGSGSAVRYFLAEPLADEQWRPSALPDGRDALDALLTALRSKPDVARAAELIGLHLSIVRGWIQRHPVIQRLVDEAQEEGKRTDLNKPA